MPGFVSPRRVRQLTFKVWSGPITTNFITKAESSKKRNMGEISSLPPGPKYVNQGALAQLPKYNIDIYLHCMYD